MNDELAKALVGDDLSIHQRMVAILTALPPIGKDQKNVQQNFMFRGHDDVLVALNPLLAKHGVFVVPHVLGRETSQRTTAKGSVMFEVSLLVEYTFWGAGGDFVRASSWGEGTDMGDKATSKAMTMAFKSVLNQAFAISNKEFADPDAQTPEPSASKPAVPSAGSTTPAAGPTDPGPAAPPASNGAEFRFASGKHQGKTLAEAPRSYVEWCVQNHPKPEVQELAAVFMGFDGTIPPSDDDIPF